MKVYRYTDITKTFLVKKRFTISKEEVNLNELNNNHDELKWK